MRADWLASLLEPLHYTAITTQINMNEASDIGEVLIVLNRELKEARLKLDSVTEVSYISHLQLIRNVPNDD